MNIENRTRIIIKIGNIKSLVIKIVDAKIINIKDD